MSLIRFGRGREYQFFRREDIRWRWDVKAATQFLNDFRQDPVVMAQFRRQAGPGGNLTDEQVIQALARQLVSGELVVALPQRDKQIPRVEATPDAPQAPPPAPARTAEPVEEEDTFDSGHDGAAQAAALIAAAKAAYPFCEECQKHMVEQMQAAGQ